MNSKIILAKNIKMDREYRNVINYNETQMLTMINSQSHFVTSAEMLSFVGKENKVLIKTDYQNLIISNYIAFQNPEYSNKWFFAWIDNVEYEGNYCYQIDFTIDFFSTYFSNITVKPCFVTRHHVNDDYIGNYTLEENLDVGEIEQFDATITNSAYDTDNIQFYICVASNYLIDDASSTSDKKGSTQYNGCQIYNKTFFGSVLYLFPCYLHEENNSNYIVGIDDVSRFLMRTNQDGFIGDVHDIFILPSGFFHLGDLTSHYAFWEDALGVPHQFDWFHVVSTLSPMTFTTSIYKKYQFDDYEPKNKKAFCYPYNYLFVSNNQGTNNIYKYEEFNKPNSPLECDFENQLAVSIGGSGRLVPKDYKGSTYRDDEAITLGKYPTCQWSSDSFTNWLTQNSVNLVTNTATTSALATAGVIALQTTASAIGAGIALASLAGNLIGQFNKANLSPENISGQAVGDIIFATNNNTFAFRKMRCKLENWKIIDEYFTRYGYKINKTIVPNITGRSNFNYVEIADGEDIGYGDIPNQARDTINNAFRKGVTIWHNDTNFGNFLVDNQPV